MDRYLLNQDNAAFIELVGQVVFHGIVTKTWTTVVLLQPCSDTCPWASGKSMVVHPSVA